jgi:hypothetical protein
LSKQEQAKKKPEKAESMEAEQDNLVAYIKSLFIIFL